MMAMAVNSVSMATCRSPDVEIWEILEAFVCLVTKHFKVPRVRFNKKVFENGRQLLQNSLKIGKYLGTEAAGRLVESEDIKPGLR